ncbi:MAG: hypothetical protein ACIALR_10535 [Blastopirellula sp. JB062]
MRLRDKDYLRTCDGLIFNALGYHHSATQATCGLKYVDGVKWLGDYQAAIQFLRERYPHYVQEIIQVPFDQVAEHYRSEDRLPQLRRTQPGGLLKKSVELVDRLASLLDIPTSAWGLTDSLLWGSGKPDSDIDLVIYGTENCQTWLSSADKIYDSADLRPMTAEHIQRPPSLTDDQFARLLRRKSNQGYYCGVRFSVRGVRDWNSTPDPLPLGRGAAAQLQLTISDHRQSLFYPVVYETLEQIEIVSFHIGYESSLRPGDRVEVRGAQVGDHQILVGSHFGREESIRLIAAA